MSTAVRFYLCTTFLAFILCSVTNNQNNKVETTFKVCRDDSDCDSLANDYVTACFQYICYPWKNDSSLAKEDRKATCRQNKQCGSHLVCFRHPYRKKVHRGLCMEYSGDCSKHSDCKDGQNLACCNGQYCCSQEYFHELQQLPCVTNQDCIDKFCCPHKNETLPSKCCDEDPNPSSSTTTTTTTTTTPSTTTTIMAFLQAFFNPVKLMLSQYSLLELNLD